MITLLDLLMILFSLVILALAYALSTGEDERNRMNEEGEDKWPE